MRPQQLQVGAVVVKVRISDVQDPDRQVVRKPHPARHAGPGVGGLAPSVALDLCVDDLLVGVKRPLLGRRALADGSGGRRRSSERL